MSSNEKKINFFDVLNDICETKAGSYHKNPEFAKAYNPFMINRGLSNFPETILHANQMNLLRDMPQSSQYDYYFNTVTKKRRRSAWPKVKKDADVSVLMEIYKVNRRVAESYLKALTPEQFGNLKEIYAEVLQGLK